MNIDQSISLSIDPSNQSSFFKISRYIKYT